MSSSALESPLFSEYSVPTVEESDTPAPTVLPEIEASSTALYPEGSPVKKSGSDPFWSEDIAVLFRFDRMVEFFPTLDASLSERLNAIARFGIYTGIIVSMYHRNIKYMYITAFILLATQFLYVNGSLQEGFESPNGAYTKPTAENPFMNVTLADYMDNVNRGPAEPYAENNSTSEQIKKDIDNKYLTNLYKDASDLFGRDGGERQFYTNPATTIPNDQGKFAQWLYGNMPSCKENNAQCLKSEDLRQQRRYISPPN